MWCQHLEYLSILIGMFLEKLLHVSFFSGYIEWNFLFIIVYNIHVMIDKDAESLYLSIMEFF